MTLFTKSPRKARTRQTLAGETRVLPSGVLLPPFGGLVGLEVAGLLTSFTSFLFCVCVLISVFL